MVPLWSNTRDRRHEGDVPVDPALVILSSVEDVLQKLQLLRLVLLDDLIGIRLIRSSWTLHERRRIHFAGR